MTPAEELQQIDTELKRRQAGAASLTTAPATTAPATTAGDELSQIEAELARRGAVPAPDTTGLPTVRAPGGPPVLPPVAPGSVPADWAKIAVPGPASAAAPRPPSPAPGAAGGRKVTASEAHQIDPLYWDVVPGPPAGPYTNEYRDNYVRSQADQQFMHDVKPSGKPQVRPLQFALSPAEERLRQDSAHLDQVRQQLGRAHQPVPGGPLDLLQRQQATSAVHLGAQLRQDGPQWQAWTQAARQYTAADDQLQTRLRAWQQGRLTPRMASQLRQDMQDHEGNRQTLMQRRGQLLAGENAAQESARPYRGQTLHYGPYLPDEIAARQGGSLTADFAANVSNPNNLGLLRRPVGALQRALGWVNENLNPLGNILHARPEVDKARQVLMLEGKYPALPPNPGQTPQARADFDRQTREVRQYFFGGGFTPAFFNPKLKSLAMGELARRDLTPWQRSLVPVFRQMLSAEEAARGPELKGILKDAALWMLAEGGAKFVGRPLLSAFGRLVAPLEARLTASTLNPLVRTGLKFGLRTGTTAASHGAGAAAAGGLGAGGMAAAEGQDWQNILNAARQGALQTAAIGAGMGAGGHLLSPRATVRAPASEFYHLPNKAAADHHVTLPDGTAFDLNKATRAELETLDHTLPADHPARPIVAARLYGPAGSHLLADVTGRRFAARDLTPADVQSMLADYGPAEHQGGLAPAQVGNRQAVAQHQTLQEAHAANQSLPVRPEAHQELRRAYRKEKVLGEGQEQALASAADALQGQRPEVARTLRAAASTIKSDFQTDYRQTDHVATGATPDREPNLPRPERSAWRKLSPAEQAALPERVRRPLILQDIHNSGTIIEPAVSPRDFVSELAKRSTEWLAGEADRRWQQAETQFAAGRAPVSDVTILPPASAAEELQQAEGAHGAAQAELVQQLTQPGAPGTGEAQTRLDEARQRLREAHGAHTESSASAAQGRYVDSLTRLGPDAPETRAALDEYRIAREQAQASKVTPQVEPPAPEPTVTLPALEEARQTRQARRAQARPPVERAKPAPPKPKPVEAKPAVNPVEGFPREKLRPGQAIQKVDAEGKPLGPRGRVTEVNNRTVTYTEGETGQPVTQRLDKFMRSPFVPVEEGPTQGRKGGAAGTGIDEERRLIGRKPGGKTIAPELHAEASRHEREATRNGQTDRGYDRHMEKSLALRARARGLDRAVAPAETAKQRFLREADQSPDGSGYDGPTVQKNLHHIGTAITGRPLEITGFRSERGERIPGTGTFYAATPGHALGYSGKHTPLPEFQRLTVEDLRFENPFVLNGGHGKLVGGLRSLPLSPVGKAAIKAAHQALLMRGERGYALLDKAISSALRRAGYDALVYRHGGDAGAHEIVDLRLHEAGTDDNGRPVRQKEGTPAKDVSDWQHWGLGFPAGWDQSTMRAPTVEPEGRKGGEKRTGAGRQAIDEAAEPEVSDTFHRSRGNPVATDATAFEATKSAIANAALGAKRFVAGFRRTFPDLVARDDPELHRMLVERLNGVVNAAQVAQRRVHDALRHLTPDERDLWEFRRFVTSLVTDAGKQRERHLKQGFAADQFKAVLPDGITEAQATLSQQRLNQHLQSQAKQAGLDPAKLDAADQAVTDYRNTIVPDFDHLYREVNGVDLKLRDNIETYMRHQILFLDQVLGEGTGPRTRIDANPRASHLQAQLGSELPYNTNWVEAEMDWLPKMIRQIGDLQIIKHIKDNYDIAPAMRLAEAELNSPGMIAALQGHAAGTPLSGAHLDVLARMAAEHRLPDRIDGQYRGLLNALLQLHADNTRLKVAGQAALPLSPEMAGVLKEYAGFLQKPEKDGLVSIRSIVDDPKWQQRNNYAEFQPIEGHHYFQALTVPEKLLQAAMSGADVLLDPEQLRKIRAIGAQRRTLVVPTEMKRLLEGYTPADYKNDRHFVVKGLDFALKLWKWDKLYNPAHSGIYFLNNARSDADATFRGHTRAYWDLIPRSLELAKFMRGAEASPILKEWLDRNGMGSTFVAAAEMQTGVGLNPLERYATREQPAWKQRTTAARRAFHNTMILPHEWREATFRYTNFYTWVKEMENNGGMPKSFGASDSTEIRGIANIYDKAMALSNDLIGPYNKVSAGGQWLRKNAFPFWSWQEVLVHRELQLFRNAVLAPKMAMEAGQRLSAGRAGLVWGGAMARYFAGVAAYGATVEALNRLRFGANYRQALPKELRGRTEPVMLWRRNPATGQLLYLDKPTNFGDFADLFHLNGIPGYVEALGKGRMTRGEWIEDMLWNGPKERLIQQAGPHLKMPLELLTGLALYPDPNRPHKVTMAQSIARELSLDKAYTMLQGLPLSPPARIKLFGKEIGGRAPAGTPFIGGQDMIHLLNTNVLDMSEANFFDAKSDARQWLARRKQATGNPGTESDAMHDAAYYFRLALRYGDQRSAEQALWQYARLGGTDKAMKASLWAMQPLHGLPAGDEARYLAQLHPDDRERLRSAYRHWANIVASDVHPGEYETLPLREFLPGLRGAVKATLQRQWGSTAKQALGHRIDQGRSLDPVIRKVQGLGEAERTDYLTRLSPVGQERLKERYRQFAGRAAPDLKLTVDEKLPLVDWVQSVDEQIAEYRREARRKANREAAYRGSADAELEQGE